MQEFLEKMYNSNIEIILRDFSKEEIPEISEGYFNYLKDTYFNVLENGDDINKVFEIFDEVEKHQWINAEKEEKQIFLIKDHNLGKMKDISAMASKGASKRLESEKNNLEYMPEISVEEANNYIEEMKKILEKVRDFNKDDGKMLLSESIVDFEYATNQTDNMSFRTARKR